MMPPGVQKMNELGIGGQNKESLSKKGHDFFFFFNYVSQQFLDRHQNICVSCLLSVSKANIKVNFVQRDVSRYKELVFK